MKKRLASCIGCGCDDDHACEGGCWWLRVDHDEGVGVCSACPAHIEAWDRGDRTSHAEPVCELERPLERVACAPRPMRKTVDGRCDHDWPYEDVEDGDHCRHCGMSFLRYFFTECP